MAENHRKAEHKEYKNYIQKHQYPPPHEIPKYPICTKNIIYIRMYVYAYTRGCASHSPAAS